jgi:hypothetical protein
MISRLYYDNQNYFSRAAIISYVLNIDINKKLIFLKDNINITPLKLRIYLLEKISCKEIPIPEAYSFFITELINNTIQEILWTEASINDLIIFNDLDLSIQLNSHRKDLVNLLLNILKLTHETNSINIVKNIINNPELSEEDSFFVCELLENILKPELKEIIIPIFEPITFQARKNKCKKQFYISSLSVNERLADILMHDFNILDSYIKQLVIELLHNQNIENNLINAFRSSKISNLKIASNVKTELKGVFIDKKIAI